MVRIPWTPLRPRVGWGLALLLGSSSCLDGLPPEAPPLQREEARGPATRPAPRLDFEAHVSALRKELPEGFHLVVEPPFVVLGDEEARRVRSRAKRTVKWAVDLLRKAYFSRDPDSIIDIWLFKDRRSYLAHAKELFGEVPTTPFGYYSPENQALIMNIATGGGTLVHEIVHPFVRANFPACPAWLNEGLGSLYEQCHEKDGKIMGLTNWRLRGLQEAIREKRVPSFKKLCGTTESEFYREDRGTNYAQARYLCYYLQEKGRLRTYWREFRKNRKKDPTGYRTLKKVLGAEDMAAFRREWETFVLSLRHP